MIIRIVDAMRLIFSFLFLASLFSMSGCFAQPSFDSPSSFANIQLSNIRDDMDLFKEVRKLDAGTQIIRRKIAQSILRKILLISKVEPDISLIRGDALETLCLLTEEEGLLILEEANSDKLMMRAKKYLLRIKEKVRARIAVAQETMLGSGCFLSPQ